MSPDKIAKVCHQVNKAACEAYGDHSQVDWDDAPEWQREAALHGVNDCIMGVLSSESLHNSWMHKKIEDGWKWGPIKNPAAKEHPDLVPYEQLPVSAKLKDYLFKEIVQTLKDM